MEVAVDMPKNARRIIGLFPYLVFYLFSILIAVLSIAFVAIESFVLLIQVIVGTVSNKCPKHHTGLSDRLYFFLHWIKLGIDDFIN